MGTLSKKTELIARIYVDSNNSRNVQSSYSSVGVNFSIIEKGTANQEKNPNFILSYDLTNKKMDEYSNIDLLSSVEKKAFCGDSEKKSKFLGYDLTMNGSSRNLAFHKMDSFVKAVKPVIRRAEKIADDEGINNHVFSGYVMAFLKALKVKSITFEEYSEMQGFTRWKTYPLMDLPELLEKAKVMASEL